MESTGQTYGYIARVRGGERGEVMGYGGLIRTEKIVEEGGGGDGGEEKWGEEGGESCLHTQRDALIDSEYNVKQ